MLPLLFSHSSEDSLLHNKLEAIHRQEVPIFTHVPASQAFRVAFAEAVFLQVAVASVRLNPAIP